jgi:3-oxoadipate enol-lactonase
MNPAARLALSSVALLAVSCTTALSPKETAAPSPARPVAAASVPIARRSAFATVSDGTRIYWEACGSGPAIVLVHGLGGNHAVWFPQVAHFARTHTVVTLSQRGFAPSGGGRDRYDVATLVEDLRAVMAAAGIARAVVVGQSMGGWTALGLALAAPERVSGLVLADTFGGIVDDAIEVHLTTMTAAAKKLGSAPPPLGVHPALSPAFSANRPDLGYLYQTLATFGSPRPDVIAGQLAASRADAKKLVALDLPVLFVVGADDRLFPPALIERAASKVAGAKVATIDGAGHSPYFEKPGEWNGALERFLAGG